MTAVNSGFPAVDAPILRACSRGFANLRGVGRAGAGLRTVGPARRWAENAAVSA